MADVIPLALIVYVYLAIQTDGSASELLVTLIVMLAIILYLLLVLALGLMLGQRIISRLGGPGLGQNAARQARERGRSED